MPTPPSSSATKNGLPTFGSDSPAPRSACSRRFPSTPSPELLSSSSASPWVCCCFCLQNEQSAARSHPLTASLARAGLACRRSSPPPDRLPPACLGRIRRQGPAHQSATAPSSWAEAHGEDASSPSSVPIGPASFGPYMFFPGSVICPIIQRTAVLQKNHCTSCIS